VPLSVAKGCIEAKRLCKANLVPAKDASLRQAQYKGFDTVLDDSTGYRVRYSAGAAKLPWVLEPQDQRGQGLNRHSSG